MRNLSSNYSVTYELIDNKFKKKCNGTKTACYSQLYRTKIESNDILILSDFLCKETKEYQRIYLKRIAKICSLKIISLEENRISLTGFKNIFVLKLFTTLFRILFEVYSDYGTKGKTYSERTKDFFNSYINKKNRSEYKDMLERLIYYYQKNKCYHGPGHGITRSQNQLIRIRNSKEVVNWSKNDQEMQDFFK